MIRNEKCEVLDKQNFEPKYRMVYDRSKYNTLLMKQDKQNNNNFKQLKPLA
jgi:hypothetical protein